MKGAPNKTFTDLMNVAETYITREEDLNNIERAYTFAEKQHEGQYRKSGEPYVIHILQVGYILATLHVGPDTIVAGLLHDVIEDTDVTHEELSDLFGKEVVNLVDGVTKIGNIEFKDREEYQAANHRKLFIAMANDIRVILIKLVDRLHNMRTLHYMPKEKQQRIAQETLDVYAPIAHRLGISEIKNELEDLCFYYLNPNEYYQIADMVEVRRVERDAYVEEMIKDLSILLDKADINYRIFGRSKHLYSIYQKMKKKNLRFDEIHDLLALRVITENELECYESLGYIHSAYKPIPGRLKDYIAMPKFNMYQSLHTTVVGVDGQIFEIQIRTERMDEIAEQGVAAHWRYKEGTSYSQAEEQKQIEEKLHWFRDLINLKNEDDIDDQEFMEHLQKDMFETDVYVMTPKGRVIDLPKDATPVDFAYKIHTEVGHSMIGAVVNGSLVPLNTPLKTGDVVNINTSKQSQGPSRDWLKFVKTSGARSKIRSYFSKKERLDRAPTIELGKEMLLKEMNNRNLDIKDISSKEFEEVYRQFSLTSEDDFYYAIGSKSLALHSILEKLSKKSDRNGKQDIKARTTVEKRIAKGTGVTVSGLDSVMISLAACCKPVKGDDIIGYITRGKGVTVHRQDCHNIQNQERLIDCEWSEDNTNVLWEADLEITSHDRNYLLTDLVTVLSQHNSSLIEVNSKVITDKLIVITKMNISVKDKDHLDRIMQNLKKVDNVISVERK